VIGTAIFDLAGKKLYDLRGTNIYRLSSELVGHLNRVQGSENRLDRATEKLFQWLTLHLNEPLFLWGVRPAPGDG
jgi:hypothetical protein